MPPSTAPPGSRKPKLHLEGDVIKRFTERFRKLDISRNGLLEKSELAAFLPDLPEKYINALFQRLDKDKSGSVDFEEFVEFVFAPVRDTFTRNVIDAELMGHSDNLMSVQQLKEQNFTELHLPASHCIELTGSSLFKQLNGLMDPQAAEFNGYQSFEWPFSRRAKELTPLPGTPSTPSTPNFSVGRMDNNLQLFFGSTLKKQFGWFLARAKPAAADPVMDYIMFNPSPLAETPNFCRAIWETPQGKRDKRLLCKVPDTAGEAAGSQEVPSDYLLEDELWEMAEDAADADWRQGDWESEWAEQPGEAWGENDDFDSGDEADKSRRARAEQDKAKESSKQQRNEEAVTQAEAEAEAKKASKKKKKRRKQQSSGEYMKQAPGFHVRNNGRHSDHLAAQRAGKQAAKTKEVAEVDEKAEAKKPAPSSRPVRVDPREWETYEDGLFIDKDFPPCTQSLGAPMAEVQGWKRLSKLHEDPCLFHRIVPEDVFPRSFASNLWLLSACAAAAEYPAWIQSMFGRRTRLSSVGRYIIRLFHPGKACFLRVTVDDYVPVSGSSPFFTGITSAGEIWVALVEKALAKLCGSYADTEWGFNAYGLHYICGGSAAASWERIGPSRWRRSCTVWNGGDGDFIERKHAEGFNAMGDWRDEEEVWSMLQMSMQRCYPIACGIDKDMAEDVGLLTDRMYSVVSAREVPVKEGLSLRMLLLRNPFGIGEWLGRWSDKSPLWQSNPEVRQALQQESREDGAFWIAFTDFLENFGHIDIVRKSMPVQGCCPAKLVEFKKGLSIHASEE